MARDLRVCSPDVFLTYFRFGVSPGDVSGLELRAFLLSSSSSPESAASRLLELAKSAQPRKAQTLVDRLIDYADAEELTDEGRRGLILSLFDVGDELWELVPETEGLFDFGIEVSMSRLTWSLIRRLDEAERYTTLRQGTEEGRALSFIVRQISHLRPSHGTTSDEALLSAERVSELEAMVLERIRRHAADGLLVDVPDLAYVIYRWTEWGDPSEAKTWTAQVAANPDTLAKLLVAFLSDIRVESLGGEGEGRRSTRHVLDPKDLEPFIDPSSLVEPTQQLLERESLEPRSRLAAETFLRDYETRARGGDPRTAHDS